MLTVYSAFVIVTVGVSLRTVAFPVRAVPCRVADTVTEVSAVTLNALTANVAVVAPDFTEMLAGTDATVGFELLKLTTVPSDAGPVSITVPVAGPPPYSPMRLEGDIETDEREDGGTMVKLALCLNEL